MESEVLSSINRQQRSLSRSNGAIDLDFAETEEEGVVDDTVVGALFPLHNYVAPTLQRWWRQFLAAPIVVYYKFLWQHDRRLLLTTILYFYIRPFVNESLPWWLNKRTLANFIRGRRIAVEHNMITGGTYNARLLVTYVAASLLLVVIDVMDRSIATRVALANKYAMRRLVLQKLLYAEIPAYRALLSNEHSEGEGKLFKFVSQAVLLFHSALPGFLFALYGAARDTRFLLKRLPDLDPLIVGQPIIAEFTHRVVDWFRHRFVEDPQEKRQFKNRQKTSRLLSAVIRGLPDIQANNMQSSYLARLEALRQQDLGLELGSRGSLIRVWNLMQARSLFEFIFEVTVAHIVMEKHGMTHSEYATLQSDALHVVQQVRRAWGFARIAEGVFEYDQRATEIVNVENYLDETGEHDELPPLRSIELMNVTFSFPDSPRPALRNCSLRFRAGTMYALVGQNRSGKSTLAQLLCKLLLPESGEILYNDIPYDEIGRLVLRERVAYVPQRPFLFGGTIRDNIAVGSLDASDAEIIEAARAAGVFTFANELDKNASPSPQHRDREGPPPRTADAILDFMVDERGTNVSGGFGQSIALARVFVRKSAGLIILDEATAAMDGYKKRQVVLPSLRELVERRGNVLIVVTHDINICQAVDYVVVLARGRLAHEGTHRELVEQEAEEYGKLLVGDAV